jgi:hypothetical protein
VRKLVTAAVVAACLGLFYWEWAAAPRVRAGADVERRLRTVRGELYLGSTFEGLPLRTVRPFLYSDCIPHRPHYAPCTWVVIRDGRVAASSRELARHARAKLRRVA